MLSDWDHSSLLYEQSRLSRETNKFPPQKHLGPSEGVIRYQWEGLNRSFLSDWNPWGTTQLL